MPTADIFGSLTEPFGRDYIRASLTRSAESTKPSIATVHGALGEALVRAGVDAETINNLQAIYGLAIAQAVAQGAALQALAMMERTEIDYAVCKFVHENTLPTPRPGA